MTKNQNEELPKPNPRGLDQCEFEKRQSSNKCSGCEQDIFDMQLCTELNIKYRLSQQEKLLQAILEELKKRS